MLIKIILNETVILTTWGAEIGKVTLRGQPRKIVLKTPSPKKQSKMDWRCGSSRRTSALQGQSPEFKPQSHKTMK
jgi:hypothetical protein